MAKPPAEIPPVHANEEVDRGHIYIARHQGVAIGVFIHPGDANYLGYTVGKGGLSVAVAGAVWVAGTPTVVNVEVQPAKDWALWDRVLAALVKKPSTPTSSITIDDPEGKSRPADINLELTKLRVAMVLFAKKFKEPPIVLTPLEHMERQML